MAKISVYVPDDLLADAKKADPDVRLSSVLQDALRSRLFDRSGRPYAVLNDYLRDELDVAQQQLVDRVGAAWRSGFGIGLDFAKVLPWEAFETFAALDWDLSAWRKTFDEERYVGVDTSGGEPEHWVLDFGNALVEASDSGWVPMDDDGTPIGVVAEGFVDAIRGVWTGSRALRSVGGETVESGNQPKDTDDQPA